jgi:hypothetical protein
MGWQKMAGYNWRALIEADIGRYKRVIREALRSRMDARQATEVVIAVRALNRMLRLGRPRAPGSLTPKLRCSSCMVVQQRVLIRRTFLQS